ncbi:MAG: VapE domain-containing protein, partial [Limosilactobacillus vaginalis]
MSEDKVVPFDKDNASKLSKMVDEEDPFIRTAKGAIKPKSLFNIEVILEHDPQLVGMFKFNEFTGEIDVARSSDKPLIKKGMLKDSYVDELASYIETSKDYGQVLFTNQLIRSALTVVANRHRYNPVLEYMNSAYEQWDHQERLDTFFSDYLGVERSEVTRLITKLFFVGAVAKVYDPKRKFDFVLDLVGGQGAGKTTILQKIAPCGYYTDQFSSFENKDDFAVMRRSLIVNDDEMTATTNSTFEVLKKFVTLQEFEYRKPYGHQAERFSKCFVLA